MLSTITRRLCGVAAVAMFAMIAGAAAPASTSGDVIVKVANFTFEPETLTVPVGTTVTWVNEDDVPHTIVSDDKTTFRSKVLDTDERFSFTFKTVGSFPYFCSIHPHMTGKVVVTAPQG